MKNADELKKTVRDKYAGIVLASEKKPCCCSCDESEFSVFNESYLDKKGYFNEADLGLGCGLPTDYAGIRTGDSVLDLGSGAGNDCFVARSFVGESGNVTGLDFTPEMIQKAKANSKKLGFTNVDFVEGDIETIPFGSGSFDVVISNCVLNLVPDKKKAFSEIFRVLKEGGRICVSDIVLGVELPEKVRETAALYAGCVSGALIKEEYLRIVRDAGFNNIKIEKEREIPVPDEMYLEHISREELDKLREQGTAIYSITMKAFK